MVTAAEQNVQVIWIIVQLLVVVVVVVVVVVIIVVTVVFIFIVIFIFIFIIIIFIIFIIFIIIINSYCRYWCFYSGCFEPRSIRCLFSVIVLVRVTNNGLSEDYSHPDDHTRQTSDHQQESF